MSVQLNHTIVWCKDKHKSSEFFAEVLGLPKPTTFGPFQVIQLENDISLDFKHTEKEIAPQHYAFLITEKEFDEIYTRICDKNLKFWPDPSQEKLGQINHNDGGRGVYFEDLDGHLLEVITRPYGSGG
ncbi:VOC family protein [Francisellaceae bacterium]|nr:VOC family protein [Francisellaceae bacterium]